MKKYNKLVISLMTLNLLAGCQTTNVIVASPTPSATAIPTATPTPVPTATLTPVPTATSTPVPTATPTPTPVSTATPIPDTTEDEIRVTRDNITNQGDYSFARSINGEFIFVWSDKNSNIFAKKYNGRGEPIPGEFRVNRATGVKGERPEVAMDKDGNFAVAWITKESSDPYDTSIYVRRFKSNGEGIGDEFKIHNEQIRRKYTEPDISMSDTGEFSVSWTGYAKYNGDLAGFQTLYDSIEIYSRKFNAKGEPVESLKVLTLLAKTGAHRTVTGMDSQGNYYVVWNDDSKLNLRKYGKNGNQTDNIDNIDSRLNGPSVEGAEASSHNIAVNGNGAFTISWFSSDENSTEPQLRIREYTSNLTPITPIIDVNPGMTFSASTRPGLAMDNNNRFYISINESNKLADGKSEVALFTGKSSANNGINLVKTNKFISPDQIDEETYIVLDGIENLQVSWTTSQLIFYKKFK